jgi:hypothetical protein
MDEEFRSSTFIHVCFYPKFVFKQVLVNVYETDAHETVKITWHVICYVQSSMWTKIKKFTLNVQLNLITLCIYYTDNNLFKYFHFTSLCIIIITLHYNLDELNDCVTIFTLILTSLFSIVLYK